MGKVVTTGKSIASTEVTTREYTSGKLKNETIFTNDDRDIKISETIHTYVGTKLTKTEKTIYASDGTTVISIDTIDYFEDSIAGGNKAIEKRS